MSNPWFSHVNPWFCIKNPGFPKITWFFQTRVEPVTNPWFYRDNPWKKHGFGGLRLDRFLWYFFHFFPGLSLVKFENSAKLDCILWKFRFGNSINNTSICWKKKAREWGEVVIELLWVFTRAVSTWLDFQVAYALHMLYICHTLPYMAKHICKPVAFSCSVTLPLNPGAPWARLLKLAASCGAALL